FWIDSRAVLAQITSSIIENYSAVIEEGNRTDGIYTNGPALTSASTMTANASAPKYEGDRVTVIKKDTTTRVLFQRLLMIRSQRQIQRLMSMRRLSPAELMGFIPTVPL
ncbi:SH3-like domain-containing protein, partial [Oenococcus oeni]